MNVQGKNVVLLEDVSGTWTPYGCARSVSINISTDFIETSVSGTGLNATFLPTKNSFTISMDGVVAIAETGKLSIADLRAKQLAHTILSLRYQRTDDAVTPHTYSEECQAFISSSSDTGSFEDMDTFSIEMRGTGAITQISTP